MVRKYTVNQLLDKAPLDATHLSFSVYSYCYIYHDEKGHRVWLGLDHGG